MKVTRVEEVTKSRSRVYLDDQFAFVLYKGELGAYHIALGEELAPEDYETITRRLLPRRARLRVMNLLKNRDYTTKQLRDKLKDGGYPEEAVQEALAYAAQLHYTDDLRYAVNFISGHENSRSRKRIEQDLLNRGVSKETIEQAWREWSDRGGSRDEAAMIQALLEKRGYDPKRADSREKQRQGAFLLRRGFSGQQVRRALFSDSLFDDDGTCT